MDIERLIQAALLARDKAYVPYSHYSVGAAIMTDSGEIIDGCNIENASYGGTNCAERTAVFKAVSEGKRAFCAIAIAGGKEKEEPVTYAYPCGICRQVLNEFVREPSEFYVIVAKSTTDYRQFTLSELLPAGFGGDELQ